MTMQQATFYAICFLLAAYCVAIATTYRGRRIEKIRKSIVDVAAAYGVFSIYILFTRSYYSRFAILVAIVASGVLATLSVLIAERTKPQKIVVLGPRSDLRYVPGAIALRVGEDLPPSTALILVSKSRGGSVSDAGLLASAAVSGVPIRSLPEYVEESQGRVIIESFDIEHLPDQSKLENYAAYKRIMDIIVCILAVPVVCPIVLLFALAIFATMGRPILFTQPRVGMGGRVFTIYKLRSMKLAPAASREVATAVADDRITNLGRFMRRFRIDELPQIFNIFRGDMSVIGPRPEQPSLTATYRKRVPEFAYRTLVRPGLSGWAQVNSGYADDLDGTISKLSYDLYYLKNFSAAMDLHVAYRTVITILFGTGAR